MWYPNRAQWLVIWIMSVLGFLLFLDSAPFHTAKMMEGRLALGIVWLGSLLTWQLSRPLNFTWRATHSLKWGVAVVLLSGLAILATVAAHQRKEAAAEAEAAAMKALGAVPETPGNTFDASELSAMPPKKDTLESLGFEPEKAHEPHTLEQLGAVPEAAPPPPIDIKRVAYEITKFVLYGAAGIGFIVYALRKVKS